MDEIVQFGIMSFKEFISESFEPKQTKYGFDLKNTKWKELDQSFFVTYFKNDGLTFVVLFRLGHVGFGISSKEVNLSSITTFAQLNRYFTFKPRAVSSAMRIFNIVLYIIQQGILHFQPKEIFFNGSNSDLERLYNKLVKDKSFLKVITSFGYEYTGSTTNLHIFKRT